MSALTAPLVQRQRQHQADQQDHQLEESSNHANESRGVSIAKAVTFGEPVAAEKEEEQQQDEEEAEAEAEEDDDDDEVDRGGKEEEEEEENVSEHVVGAGKEVNANETITSSGLEQSISSHQSESGAESGGETESELELESAPASGSRPIPAAKESNLNQNQEPIQTGASGDHQDDQLMVGGNARAKLRQTSHRLAAMAANNSLSSAISMLTHGQQQPAADSPSYPAAAGPLEPIGLGNQTKGSLHQQAHNGGASNGINVAKSAVKQAEPQQMHVCRLCDKLLSSSSSLDRHMLTHSGERPFVCKRCHMTFTTNGNMHRHMRTHLHKDSLARQQQEQQLKSLVGASISLSNSNNNNNNISIGNNNNNNINAPSPLGNNNNNNHHHHQLSRADISPIDFPLDPVSANLATTSSGTAISGSPFAGIVQQQQDIRSAVNNSLAAINTPDQAVTALLNQQLVAAFKSQQQQRQQPLGGRLGQQLHQTTSSVAAELASSLVANQHHLNAVAIERLAQSISSANSQQQVSTNQQQQQLIQRAAADSQQQASKYLSRGQLQHQLDPKALMMGALGQAEHGHHQIGLESVKAVMLAAAAAAAAAVSQRQLQDQQQFTELPALPVNASFGEDETQFTRNADASPAGMFQMRGKRRKQVNPRSSRANQSADIQPNSRQKMPASASLHGDADDDQEEEEEEGNVDAVSNADGPAEDEDERPRGRRWHRRQRVASSGLIERPSSDNRLLSTCQQADNQDGSSMDCTSPSPPPSRSPSSSSSTTTTTSSSSTSSSSTSSAVLASHFSGQPLARSSSSLNELSANSEHEKTGLSVNKIKPHEDTDTGKEDEQYNRNKHQKMDLDRETRSRFASGAAKREVEDFNNNNNSNNHQAKIESKANQRPSIENGLSGARVDCKMADQDLAASLKNPFSAMESDDDEISLSGSLRMSRLSHQHGGVQTDARISSLSALDNYNRVSDSGNLLGLGQTENHALRQLIDGDGEDVNEIDDEDEVETDNGDRQGGDDDDDDDNSSNLVNRLTTLDGEIIEDISQSYVKTANPNAARKGGKRNRHCYKCKLCTYSSVDRCTLVRHLRIHSGERPYICGICRYAFTTKANCERHVRKRHKKQYNSLGGAGGGGVKGSNGGGRSLIITDHSNHQTIPVKVNPVAAQTISQTLQRIQEKQQQNQNSGGDEEEEDDGEDFGHISSSSSNNNHSNNINTNDNNNNNRQHHFAGNVDVRNATETAASFTTIGSNYKSKRKLRNDDALEHAMSYQRRRLTADKHDDRMFSSTPTRSRKNLDLNHQHVHGNITNNSANQQHPFLFRDSNSTPARPQVAAAAASLNSSAVPGMLSTNELFVNLMTQLQQVTSNEQNEATNNNNRLDQSNNNNGAPLITTQAAQQSVPAIANATFLANMLAASKRLNTDLTDVGGQQQLGAPMALPNSLLTPEHLSQQFAQLRNLNPQAPFFTRRNPFNTIDLAPHQALDLSCKFQSLK